jgi:hypothetical protein
MSGQPEGGEWDRKLEASVWTSRALLVYWHNFPIRRGVMPHVTPRGGGMPCVQLGIQATEVPFFYIVLLYIYCTNYKINFSSYASRDKSVEPDER